MIRSFIVEFIIAIRYLRAKKKEAFISLISMLSLLGITIGVAALIVVMSVMNGYGIELSQKLKGFNSDIIITGEDYKLPQYNQLVSKIKKNTGLTKVIPIISEQSLIVHNDISAGVVVKAMKSSDMGNYSFLLGNAQNIKNKNGIIIGNVLARSLGIRVGDTIKLVSPKFDKGLLGNPVPRMQEFQIEGIFRSGLSEYDGLYVITNISEAQKLFDFKNSVSKIEMFLTVEQDLQKIKNEVIKVVGEQYQVIDWKMMNKHIFNALKTERVVMFIILAFIIIVAAFNIISSLVMLVMDKTKEIAILRTIGFSQMSILRIFLMCGMILGLVGTVLGIGLGVAFAYNINGIKEFLSSITGTNLFDPVIYYLDVLPSVVDMRDVTKIAILSAVLSFASTLYPAFKASRMLPVQGIKND